MAVIFADGFDWYASSDITKRWTAAAAAQSVSAAAARPPSGQGLANGASGVSGSLGQYKSFGANYAQGIIGIAFLGASLTASRVVIVALDGTTEQISLRTNSSSVLTVTRGGTVLATGSTVLSAATWYYAEVKFTINNTTGVVEVKLNGAAEIASTGSLNTRSTANNYWNGIGIFNTNAGGFTSYDDVYAIDPTAGSNTTFLGPVKVIAMYPSEPGATSSWTPNGGTNEGCVSEAYEDGDNSFVASSTVNQVDTYKMQDPPASTGSVFAVQPHIIARTAGVNSIAPVMRPASTDRVGTTVALGATYADVTQVYDVSPETSSAWTVSELAALEVGMKLIS